jgi:mannose-6-phosphate isomerase-like protein (cupin superfamily)
MSELVECSMGLEQVMAYLVDELDDAAVEVFEDHLFACGVCAERLAMVERLRAEVASTARRAEIGVNVNSAFLERAVRDGLTLREYRIPAGESVACKAGPEDLVVVRLAAPFGDFQSFDLAAVLEDIRHDTVATLPSRSVVIDRAREEVILVFPGELVRSYPRSRWTMRLHAVGPAGERDIGPFVMDHSESFDFGGFGVDWKIDARETGRQFSVVHHPMAPHALAAPLHRHSREDEYSYVIEGTLGALLGHAVVTAGPGTWVHKPRHQWHTFWNAGETRCTIIEVIAPGGFEQYFRDVAAAWGDLQKFAELNAQYGLEMDFESVPGLCERFGLSFPSI